MMKNLQLTTYNLQQKQNGQVMLLTVLILSALFLSATAVAGLLMVYQLSQVTKIAESAQAIFAADAGIERSLFLVYRCNPPPPDSASPALPIGWDSTGFQEFLCASARLPVPAAQDCTSGTCLPPTFWNDASYQVTIDPDVATNPDQSTVTSIKSTGRSGRSARAFEVRF